ncbi:MAG: toll/interleukin-1 receptor domain-containing protein, partial [Ferruginibacter sp.]
MKETTFFSYARSDLDFVLKLAKKLREAGAELWMDTLDIKAGKRWDESVEAALNNASRLVVILSPASVSSHNVMDEVN